MESASPGNLFRALTPDLLNQTLWRKVPETHAFMSPPGDSEAHWSLGSDQGGQGEQPGLVLWHTNATEAPGSFSPPAPTPFAHGFHLCGSKVYSRYHVCIPGREMGRIRRGGSLYRENLLRGHLLLCLVTPDVTQPCPHTAESGSRCVSRSDGLPLLHNCSGGWPQDGEERSLLASPGT